MAGEVVRVPMTNRVTPMGDVVAIPLRGAWTGNRGRLHEGGGAEAEVRRFHSGDLWIICALDFNDRWHEQWRPRRFTWLYFHDEAVALAAGHRPCAECRWGSYVAYRQAWMAGLGVERPTAGDMNRRLHGERLVRGTHRRRTHALPWRELPDGTFVRLDEVGPALVVGDAVVPWTTEGYAQPRRHRPRPGRGDAEVVTPPASVAVLGAGYAVQIDASAATEPA
jgi:hypothetical protein